MPTPIEKYDYFLPQELIALNPSKNRDECKMIVAEKSKKSFYETYFKDIINIIDDNSFLVVNNTRVRNARLNAKKVTGGKSEIFVTEVLSDGNFKGLLRGSFKVGAEILVEDNVFKLISKDDEGIWLLDSNGIDINKLMENIGRVPLPPYINRQDNLQDKLDYQTVYSKYVGSSAAPTAGLHFTKELIDSLKNNGIEILEITLHVGLGTFKPVKTEFLENHIMHAETYNIDGDIAEKINELKNSGKKLIAVGSTTVRALESAIDDKNNLIAGKRDTNIFIKEGYNFKIVDEMVTNFHLPKSTLLAMVSAFAGYEFVKDIYKFAVSNNYRFFSYGDCMYIKK